MEFKQKITPCLWFDDQAEGWLKDKYGLSWQIVPKILIEMISDPDHAKSQKAMAAMLKMKKIDIADLERAVAS